MKYQITGFLSRFRKKYGYAEALNLLHNDIFYELKMQNANFIW